MQLIIRFIVNAIVLFLIAKFVPGFNHDIGIGTALIAAVVFGLVNALIGPILRLITLLNWITHGLFAIVVNFKLFLADRADRTQLQGYGRNQPSGSRISSARSS